MKEYGNGTQAKNSNLHPHSGVSDLRRCHDLSFILAVQGQGKLDKANEMDTDLRGRVVALEHSSQNRESRLVALEAWRTQRDIDGARHDERWRHMDEKIDGISRTLSRINWLIIAGIIAGFIGFMIRGGFAP